MSSVFLGIAGGSCSGKTTLVSYLTNHLDFNVSTLAFDSYYCDQGHLSLDQRALVNYDHPDSLDVAMKLASKKCIVLNPDAIRFEPVSYTHLTLPTIREV